jgi:hypothetical protein
MKAAKLLPFLKLEASATEATSALAASGPMPGIVARRLLAWFDLCHVPVEVEDLILKQAILIDEAHHRAACDFGDPVLFA